MTRDTYEKLKQMGISFDDDFENLIVKPFEQHKKKMDEKKKLNEDTLISSNIKDVDFIDQTLYENIENSANGFYYLYDGTFLGKYGTSKELVVCAKKNDREDKKSKLKWEEFLSPIRLVIENEEFIHFSATIFAESLMGYDITIKEEVFAFATTIGNYVDKIKKDSNKVISYKEAIKANGVYGAGSPNYKIFDEEKDRNSNPKMLLAISAVINEITNGFDYSYGATYWDGIDINKAKWADGLKFTKDSHDVFGLKDNKNEGKEFWKDYNKKDTKYLRRKWEYVYVTTVAYSGENQKRKNRYYPYFKDDKQNMFKYGTTFMKYHPDFENIIPNKTKTDD